MPSGLDVFLRRVALLRFVSSELLVQVYFVCLRRVALKCFCAEWPSLCLFVPSGFVDACLCHVALGLRGFRMPF